MKTAVFRREDCRLCGSRELDSIFKLVATPPGDAYVRSEGLGEYQESFPLEIFLCRRCKLIQLLDVVDPEMLYRNYIYTSSVSLELKGHFDKYAEDIIAYTGMPKGSFVLDIGSNDGLMLAAFKDKGMRVLGVDPALSAADKAREIGVDTLHEFFSPELAYKIKGEYGPAYAVTANNVFANIDDLGGFIKGIKAVLSPSGYFIFETGYGLDTFKNRIIDNIHHEHLCYFTVAALKYFFRQYDMELIDVKHIPTKGGSIRGFVRLKSAQHTASSASVRQMIELEQEAGIIEQQTFESISESIAAVKKNLLNLLDALKKKGMRIAGYGASIGTTTLIYFFDIADKIEFLVDNNPVRNGMFTPGHHIAVFSSEALYRKKPDYTVIFAWRYAQPIIDQNQEYIKQFGRFIIPLPDIKVV